MDIRERKNMIIYRFPQVVGVIAKILEIKLMS